MGWYDTVKVSEPNLRGPDYSAVLSASNNSIDSFKNAMTGLSNIFSEPEKLKHQAMQEYNKALDNEFKMNDQVIASQGKRQTSDAINAYNDKVSQIKASGLPIEEQMKQIQAVSLGDKNSLADFSILNANKTALDNEMNNRLEAKNKFDQDAEFHKDTVKLQNEQLAISKREAQLKEDERKDKIFEKKLTVNASMPTEEVINGVVKKDKDGVYHVVSEEKTGNKTLDYSNLTPEQQAVIDKKNTDFANSEEIANKTKKYEENKSSIYTPEQLKDDKFLYQEYSKLNPNAGNESALGRYISKMSPGGESSDLNLEKRKIQKRIAELDGSPLQNIFRSENVLKNNKAESDKLKEDLLAINNSISKKNNEKHISFEEFKKQAKTNSDNLKKENKTISDDIGKLYDSVDKNIKSTYGVDEVKKKTEPATEDQVKKTVYDNVYNRLKKQYPTASELDLQSAAIKESISEGDSQAKFRGEKIKKSEEASKEAIKEQNKISEKMIDSKNKEIENIQNQIDKVNLLDDNKDVKFEGVSYSKKYYLELLRQQKSDRESELGNLIKK